MFKSNLPSGEDFSLASYHYDLPEENIAQQPVAKRDSSRLLVLDRVRNNLGHQEFPHILELLAPGDILVVNDTKVFPARVLGKKETGGKVELLILEYPQAGTEEHGDDGWSAVQVIGLVKSSKRPKVGSRLLFGDDLAGQVVSLREDGKVMVKLLYRGDLAELLEHHGQMPLPPYIKREEGETAEDRMRYQTVFARQAGAVAAPTAGLHFTPELLDAIRQKGVEIASVTLHVGYGTFAPVREEDIREHDIHSEFLAVSAETATAVNEARKRGGRVWAVGTTSVRALEFASQEGGEVQAKDGFCDLYIYPGYSFKVVDNLITNFHLPGSSLMFLVSALAGREQILAAYEEAVKEGYRFYSYGDAMVIVNR